MSPDFGAASFRLEPGCLSSVRQNLVCLNSVRQNSGELCHGYYGVSVANQPISNRIRSAAIVTLVAAMDSRRACCEKRTPR
ncbi:hypothetical protein SAMN06265222_101172 [Neorhodopirellula lusitana]|uniref:Uncharacterized protein n=1 Tax=Neorhodopirellula lusitana TaxID=445327 RepID=A0ABY1PN54_9BACT|nr:hypothetical protein SAMN06265222_101172 [Neorhodopirellula lusitana]